MQQFLVNMFGPKINREAYKSLQWKSIRPLDRAHILLVAERLKPMAYCSSISSKEVRGFLEKELNIFFYNARGKIGWFPNPELKLYLPEMVYTVYSYKKLPIIFKKILGQKNVNYQDLEGKLLGYPKCCRREYLYSNLNQKYSPLVLKLLNKPCNFILEAIKAKLEGIDINPAFRYLMPSQTPCSINCKKSIKLLNAWKDALQKYDPEAGASLESFNDYNNYREIKEKSILFQKKRIKPEMFKIGAFFRN